MIISSVLAGTGEQFVSLTYWSAHRYPTAVARIFGARLAVGPGTLEIGNGEISVVLDMAAAGETVRLDAGPTCSLTFSAPLISAHKKLQGFAVGQRIDIYLASLDARHRLYPWEATEQVMHTKRDLHGPGTYPEHTRWGSWINGYRAEAAARDAARRAGSLQPVSAHMEGMDTQELPAFDINHHRYVAQQVQTGRAHHHMVESSQEMLLAEVERLTYLISPAKLKQPVKGEPVVAYSLGPIIEALAKQPRNAAVVVEYFGSKSHPGEMGSYRGYHDELRIEPMGREPKTVADVLKELRRFRKSGITGYKGGEYPVTDRTGVWVADYGEMSQQHVSGVRVDGGIVVIMTEERDW